jgi:putative membrane protein
VLNTILELAVRRNERTWSTFESNHGEALMAPIIPYCGSAPVPGSATWNLDPVLMAYLLALACAHLRVLHPAPSWRRAAAAAGWAVVALALVSPLCNLSVALFSARVGQHMVLALVGAPLVALRLPRQRIAAGEVWSATAGFAAVLWFWHAPTPYEATFASPAVYWAMHLTVFATAVWLFTTLLGPAAGIWPALGSSFATGMQMSLLGALLTFSPKAWFPVHAVSTAVWGLSPIEDQQLGGLIMWVPAGLLLTGYALAAFGSELSRLARVNAGRA